MLVKKLYYLKVILNSLNDVGILSIIYEILRIILYPINLIFLVTEKLFFSQVYDVFNSFDSFKVGIMIRYLSFLLILFLSCVVLIIYFLQSNTHKGKR
jgi:hypothetical protein